MRLNRILAATAATLLCLAAAPAWGQGSYEKLVKENAELQEQITRMAEDTLALTGKIAEAEAAAGGQGEATAKAEARLKSIEDSVSPGFIAKIEADVAELEKKAEKLTAKTDSLDKAKRDIGSRLANVKGEIDEMDVYSTEKKKQTMQDNLELLKKPYSQIAAKAMAAISSTVDEYRDFDGYDDYRKRVAAAARNKQLYDDGTAALASKFDVPAINALRDRIDPFLKKKKGYELNAGQFKEIDSLDIKLSRFEGGVAELQKIINNVNNDKEISQWRETKQNGDACWEAIKKHLSRESGSSVAKAYERYFKLIPYLGNAYRKYWNELSKHPLAKTRIEEEILEYKIK